MEHIKQIEYTGNGRITQNFLDMVDGLEIYIAQGRLGNYVKGSYGDI